MAARIIIDRYTVTHETDSGILTVERASDRRNAEFGPGGDRLSEWSHWPPESDAHAVEHRPYHPDPVEA